MKTTQLKTHQSTGGFLSSLELLNFLWPKNGPKMAQKWPKNRQNHKSHVKCKRYQVSSENIKNEIFLSILLLCLNIIISKQKQYYFMTFMINFVFMSYYVEKNG